MWLSNKDFLKYPTYSAALELATSNGRRAEFLAYCTLMDADSSDTSRELCRGFDFWRRQYPEIPAWESPTTGSASARKSNVIKGSFTPGIAAVACKSDVSWAKGAIVADHYNFGDEYRSRNGYPTENLQGLDTTFWVWAEKQGLTVAQCQRVWAEVPTLEWADFRRECIEGSDIRPSMFEINVEHIVSGYDGGIATENVEDEVFNALNISTKRFFEGFEDSWNRQHDYGGAIYAFISERSGFFNAKPRIPQWDEQSGKYRKYESRRKEMGEEGNKIFYPNVDRIACDLLVQVFDLPFDIIVTPENYWDVVLAFPKLIRVGIAEGAKKAISLTGDGFPTVAVLGVTSWSVGGSQPRLLLPELVELAAGDRLVDIWYDMDDPDEKLKAFLNGKAQAFKLVTALKAAGANPKSRSMFWDLKLGKGIDDAKASLRARNEAIISWILDTIALSRQREIYAQTSKAYRLDPKRAIERDTLGDYLPGDIKVLPGFTTAIIADTGSGKTHNIRQMIQSCKAIGTIAVVFTPTNKIGEQAAYNFGIPHRNSQGEDGQAMDIGDVLSEARRRGGLVICPDSIDWARSLIKNISSYIVVCDEAAKVLEHLSSGTTIKDRYSEINENFAELIKGSQSLILAEAKLSEQDLRGFEAMSGKSTLVYRHRRETAKKQIKMYTGSPRATFAALLTEVVERLISGERVIIPTDSQRMAIKIEMFLQELFPDLRGIRNDALTSYISEVKVLTRTPNKFLADNQLDYLIYSPVCKAGWDLKGFDDEIEGICRKYHFDAVCAFLGVLPTSDHIQMIARYRVTVPLSIACPELISQVGDEINLSGKMLRKLRGEELAANIQFCGFSDKPRTDAPLQSVLDDVYIHNTIRNGLEKSISRYSLQQRLIDDGHIVTLEAISLGDIKNSNPERYETLRGVSQRLNDLGDSIERNWGDLISSVVLHPADDIKEAARIERMEAPTPADRAKAARIRLEARFTGVKFDCHTAYYATRKYGKLANGTDLHAKLLFPDLVKAAQRERNTAILNENVIAVHHFDRTAQKVELMLQVGILDLLDGEYCKDSSELIKLRADCVVREREFKRFFGLNFNLNQSPTEIYCRLLSKISLQTLSRRPGVDKRDPKGERPRYYFVATLDRTEVSVQETLGKIAELNDELGNFPHMFSLELEKRAARINELTRFESDHRSQLEKAHERTPSDFTASLIKKRQQKADRASARVKLAIFEMESFECNAAGRISAQIARLEEVVIPHLLQVSNEAIVRSQLFEGAMIRLAASTSPIKEKDKEVVDAMGEVQIKAQELPSDIPTAEQLNLFFKAV